MSYKCLAHYREECDLCLGGPATKIIDKKDAEIKRLDARLEEALARAAHLEEKMERALTAVAHFTLRYNEDLETIRTMREALELLQSRTP